jgi:hypothetical protein
LRGTDEAYTNLLKAGDLGRTAGPFGPLLPSNDFVRQKMRNTLEELDWEPFTGPCDCPTCNGSGIEGGYQAS